MPYLVQKRIDGSAIEQWELGTQPLVFGRSDKADVRIMDERLSRQHCTVAWKDSGYVVIDLQSTNGTWVNGTRVTEKPLQPNDKIRIGQTVLVFQNERAKGLATIMGELEAEDKGLHTFLGELNQHLPAPPPETGPETK